jgi:hypothetical protein
MGNRRDDLEHHLSSLFNEYGIDDDELITDTIEVITDVLGVDLTEDSCPMNKGSLDIDEDLTDLDM